MERRKNRENYAAGMMKSRCLRGILLCVFAAAFLSFSICIMRKVERIEQSCSLVQLVLCDELSPEEACWMQQQKSELEMDYDFVIWSQEMGGVIYAPSLEEKALDVNVIRTCGNTSLLFDNAMFLDVQDVSACLVSSQAANLLFGTEKVKGLSVRYKEKVYIVADVVDSSQNFFVYQAAPGETGETDGLTRVSIRSSVEKTPAFVAEEFSSEWCEGTLVDWEFVLFLEKGVVCMVYTALLLSLLWEIKRGIRGVYGKNRMAFGFWLSGSICCLVMIGKHMFLPRDYLTDISSRIFWQQLAEGKKTGFLFFLMIEKSVQEAVVIREMLEVGMLLLAVCLIGYFTEKIAGGYFKNANGPVILRNKKE